MPRPQIRRALLEYLDKNPRMKTLVLEYVCERTGFTPAQMRAAIRRLNFDRREDLHFEPKVKGQSWKIVRPSEMADETEPPAMHPVPDVVTSKEAPAADFTGLVIAVITHQDLIVRAENGDIYRCVNLSGRSR